jgi:hypothetical protein
MYSLRPSAVIGVTDPWAAYQFDMAVGQFGAWVEGKLNERDAKGKPKHKLAQLLGDDAQGEQQYRPVSAEGLRKVRVREDGTWED